MMYGNFMNNPMSPTNLMNPLNPLSPFSIYNDSGRKVETIATVEQRPDPAGYEMTKKELAAGLGIGVSFALLVTLVLYFAFRDLR